MKESKAGQTALHFEGVPESKASACPFTPFPTIVDSLPCSFLSFLPSVRPSVRSSCPSVSLSHSKHSCALSFLFCIKPLKSQWICKGKNNSCPILLPPQHFLPSAPSFKGAIRCRYGGADSMSPKVSRVASKMIDCTARHQTVNVIISVGMLCVLPVRIFFPSKIEMMSFPTTYDHMVFW